MAAGLATISLMEARGSYRRLESTSARLERGLRDGAERAGVAVTINRVGSMLAIFFTSQKVTNFEEAKRTDRGLYAAFHRSMLAEGIYLPPSPFETIFISTAHSEAVVRATVKASGRAFAKCSARTPSR
jgi:glutamate-1-semialdehyde 2,1-aminomutase